MCSKTVIGESLLLMSVSSLCGGQEVLLHFSLEVHGLPSFVPCIFRSCFAVYGLPSFVACVCRSCFTVRGSRFTVICALRSLFVLHSSEQDSKQTLLKSVIILNPKL